MNKDTFDLNQRTNCDLYLPWTILDALDDMWNDDTDVRRHHCDIILQCVFEKWPHLKPLYDQSIPSEDEEE